MGLRWKKSPEPTGIRAVTADPQGSILHDGSERYANTNYAGARFNNGASGWYWTARNDAAGVPLKNTHESFLPDETTAKAEAMAYVKAHLARRS